MLKISTVSLLLLLLRNILAQPIIVQENEPVTYQSVIFYERLVTIIVLVLLGGVFAGTFFIFILDKSIENM